MKMSPGCNVHICLKDREGRVVPGSVREGHNIFTRMGRTWLRDLIVWDSINDTPPDVPLENERLQYIQFGSGGWPETKDVVGMQILRGTYDLSPSTSPYAYFPNATTCRIYHLLSTSSLNGFVLSEMGLMTSSARYGGGYQCLFYRTFEPILKTSAFALETYWDLTF